VPDSNTISQYCPGPDYIFIIESYTKYRNTYRVHAKTKTSVEPTNTN